MTQDTQDVQQIHHRAQMLVMARLVDAKNHIRDYKIWIQIQYVVSIVMSFLLVLVLAVHFIGPDIGYVALGSVALNVALWLKYTMLVYHYRYQCKQLKRAQHAMQTLAKHHYTKAQHDAIVKKCA